MKTNKIIFLVLIALLCIGLNIPQFFYYDFNIWATLGGFGLEFGAALILFLIFDVRDKKNEEEKIQEEDKRKNNFLNRLIDSCIFEDWSIDFLKNDTVFVSINNFGMSVYRSYVEDNITQSLKELNYACLVANEYELAEKVKDLYINKRGQSELWTFKSFSMQPKVTQNIFDMVKQEQNQYNSKLEQIRNILNREFIARMEKKIQGVLERVWGGEE